MNKKSVLEVLSFIDEICEVHQGLKDGLYLSPLLYLFPNGERKERKMQVVACGIEMTTSQIFSICEAFDMNVCEICPMNRPDRDDFPDRKYISYVFFGSGYITGYEERERKIELKVTNFPKEF